MRRIWRVDLREIGGREGCGGIVEVLWGGQSVRDCVELSEDGLDVVMMEVGMVDCRGGM